MQPNNININQTLFSILKEDYETKIDQLRFNNALDYLEAMVKFLGVLSIGVVKEIDEEVYKKIFYENFKLSPSLGDFKSLATHSYTKANQKLKDKDALYDKLHTIFTKKDINLQLNMAQDIISGDTKTKKSFKNLHSLLDEYAVNFRNKLKGHGASFREDDNELSDVILDNLDKTIQSIEKKITTLLEDKDLKFYYQENKNNKETHLIHEVIAKYKNKDYKLSPLLIYLVCDKFSCTKEHRIKLFFYNDGRASKSYYLDYGYNHHFYFSSHNEIDTILMAMIENTKKLISTSDDKRKSDLLKVFIGREKELKISKEHIIDNIKKHTPSAITIQGKPGTGKSAFISKLQEELQDEMCELKSYVFYANDNMGSEEDRYFYNKLSGYFKNISIDIKKLENPNEVTAIEKLQNLFDSIKEQLKTPLVLIVDGVDEFGKPVEFLQNFPFSHIPNNVHLIFSTRGYKDILDTLKQKLFSSELNILQKDMYLKRDASLTLEGLSKSEVEILINEVLTKDIKRDTPIYQEIQEEIYARSEGLPLYIYYITDKLINLHIKEDDDIPTKILQYAKELPQGLDAFYNSAFAKLHPIASSLLYIFYFSPKEIKFDALYYIITAINKDERLDKKAFNETYFSKVEIFLNQNSDGKYTFYHLSVKEAIKNYFLHTNNLQHIVEIDYNAFREYIPIAEYQAEQYKELFDKYYYLKEDADLFKLINALQSILQEKKDDKNLREFFKDNFLGIYATYIWFKLYYKLISYEDIKAKNYSKLDNFQLPKDIKPLIKNFFTIYEKSDKTDIEEIKQAYEFALLIEDYDKVLEYSDDYQNSFVNLFIDICWNLDKEENKRKFKELKPIWSEILSDDFKRVLLSNERIAGFTEEALEVANTIEDNSEIFLVSIAKKADNIDLALQIASSVIEDWSKSEILISIIQKTDDNAVMKRALRIANSIEDYFAKLEVLVSMAQKTDDIQLVLEISNTIEFNDYKAEVLTLIAQKTNSKELFQQALDVAYSIENDYSKAEALASIAQKTNDKELSQEALNMAQSLIFQDNWHRLASIAQKTNDKELFQQALDIVYSIKDNEKKSNFLASIVQETNDIQQALEIANTIENGYYKSEALVSIVQKTDDNRLIKRALDIANTIKSNNKADILALIAQKTANKELLQQALEIASSIKNDSAQESTIINNILHDFYNPDLEKILPSIVQEIDTEELCLQALLITNFIKNDLEKLIALIQISQEINNKRAFKESLILVIKKSNIKQLLLQILKTVNLIENNLKKSDVLILIVQKIDDIDLALKIANTIKDEDNKAKVLVSIVQKIDDIQQALGIANTIKDEDNKAKVLLSIVQKIDDIQQALEIANTIENGYYKLEALVSIAQKTDSSNKALEIANTIESDYHKAKILVSIVQKTDNSELMKQALEIANTIGIVFIKSEALISIVQKLYSSNKALEIANTIENNYDKAMALASIAQKTDDIQQALKIANSIELDFLRVKALISIAQKTDDIQQALEIANSIEDDFRKSEALASIAQKTDDKKMLNQGLEISNTVIDNLERIKISNSFQSKLKNENSFINNYLYIQNQNHNIKINEALELSAIKDSDAVLRYYGIIEKEESSEFESCLEQLKELKLQRDTAESKEDEDVYDSTNKQAETIKQEIKDNEKLLEQFLKKLDVSKMKFNSDRFDILDKIGEAGDNLDI